MTVVTAAVTSDCPLVVDVDGTLIKSDLLHEATLQFVAHHPFEAWKILRWLREGKAELKARLAERVDANAKAIPLREETVAFIRAAQEADRPVYLASASDRRWIELIADRIGGITGILASDGEVNLAGRAKADQLVQKFGRHRFDYVGDHPVDVPVWNEAREQFLVSHRSTFEREVRRKFPKMTTLTRVKPRLPDYIRALRPHQWAKNILIFLPLIAGHSLRDGGALVASLVAFVAFCCAASSAYIINDLLDLPGDRDHGRKRFRPFASGAVPITHGVVIGAALMTGAFLIALTLPFRFLEILFFYVVFTLGYSFYLKRKPLIDVIVLAGLYTLRVLGGVMATSQFTSQWLLMFSLFLFLSLATVKRCSELIGRREDGKSAPLGRGYVVRDLDVLFPLGAAAGYGSVLVVTLYLSSPEVAALYSHPARMWLICPLILYWISRVLILSSRNQLHDDPVVFALTDRVSLMTGLLSVGVIAISV